MGAYMDGDGRIVEVTEKQKVLVIRVQEHFCHG